VLLKYFSNVDRLSARKGSQDNITQMKNMQDYPNLCKDKMMLTVIFPKKPPFYVDEING
jgi:hypothetical protein